MILNFIFLDRFTISIINGLYWQFILWKASGDILFWNAQGEPQWNAFLMSTTVLSKSCRPGCILDPVIMIIWDFFFPSWGNSLYFVMEKMRTIRMFSRLDTRCQNTGDVGAGSLLIFPIPRTVQSFWFTIPAFLSTKLLSLKKKKKATCGTGSTISIQSRQMGKAPFQRSALNETGRTNF